MIFFTGNAAFLLSCFVYQVKGIGTVHQGNLIDSRQEIGRIMEKYGSRLLRMSAFYLKDADFAQDAVQETFIKAYRQLCDYRGESTEKTWLTSKCVNTCRDMLRTAGSATKAGLT